MSHLRDFSKKIYTPSSNVSVDGMVVRFSGQDGYTVGVKGNSTSQSSCDSGYKYTFTPTSHLKKCEPTTIPGVNYTSRVVAELVNQFPLNGNSFNLSIYNYFSSISILQHLFGLNIGTCGYRHRSKEERCLEQTYKVFVVKEQSETLLSRIAFT
ncbi:hypothetical protein K501DRAFT_267495 [Backusella circina FSU 941]|nr:hypothetical protein K501DRAFT_267495 [Backusella circina FSU 941]